MMFDWQREEEIRQATVCREGQREGENTVCAQTPLQLDTPYTHTHTHTHTHTNLNFYFITQFEITYSQDS